MLLVWRRVRKSSGVNTAATTKLTSESCSFSENSEKLAFFVVVVVVVNVMCVM